MQIDDGGPQTSQATPLQPDLAASANSRKTLSLDDNQIRRRLDLRALNTAALSQGTTKNTRHLASNLKKNTGFIKKLKAGLTADAKEGLVKDIETLSLEKYVSEIAVASLEGSSRCKNALDFTSATEVLSLLHQRFPQTFTPIYGALLYRALQPPAQGSYDALSPEAVEREETNRIARQRSLIRLAGELYMVNILRTVQDAQDEHVFALASSQLGEEGDVNRRAITRPKGVKATSGDESFIYGVLRDLLIVDKFHDSISILLAFVKALRSYYVSEPVRKGGSTGEAMQQNEETESQLVSVDVQSKLYRLFSQYFATAARHLMKNHSEIQKQQDRNHEAYIKSGIIHEDRQSRHETFVKSFEKLLASTQSLADLLDLEMPVLKNESTSAVGRTIISGGATGATLSEELANRAESDYIEDEETRKFYDDVLDLKDVVSMSYLETKKKGSISAEMDVAENTDSTTDTKEAIQEKSVSNEGVTKAADSSVGDMAAGPAANLDALFIRMQDSSSRERIDQDAITFAMLNSRAARKRLVKHLTAVPKTRLDILPYYSRFVATVHPYMPDVSTAIVAFLDEEFRYGQRKKIPELNSLRSKTLRFLAELVKFRLVPEHLTLHVLKACLDDLTGTNIESLCIFLEGCGRFLLHNPETSNRMAASLDILLRKKQVQNLDMRYQMMIENAYYQVNPPERQAIVEKERTAMDVFIRKLIYTDLSKRTLENVLRQLRMLPWQKPEVRETLYKVFGKVWKIKYSNIPQMATIVAELCRYHSQFGVVIVDQVLEDIQIDLEMNIFRHNQRRIACIKYLGELFNFRVIDPALLFFVLWQLMTFGHEESPPHPERPPPADAKDDFFRIRLICTLLDACAIYFDKGSSRRRLDEYILFFQVYIFSKAPLSMDVSITVDDTFEALPGKIKRYDNYEAAVAALEAAFPRRGAESVGQIPQSTLSAGSDEGEENDVRADAISDAKNIPRSIEHMTPRASASDDEGSASVLLSEDDASTDDSDDDVSHDEDEAGDQDDEEHEDDEEDDDDDDDDDEDEDPDRRRAREEDDDFARELGQLTSSNNSRAVLSDTRKSNLADLSIPRRMVAPVNRHTPGELLYSPPTQAATSNPVGSAPDPPKATTFTLISRRGNKQTVQDIAIPTESSLAKAAREARERERSEQQELKRFVLRYEERGQEYVSSAPTQVSGNPQSLDGDHKQRLFPSPGARKWGRPGTLDQALREAG